MKLYPENSIFVQVEEYQHEFQPIDRVIAALTVVRKVHPDAEVRLPEMLVLDPHADLARQIRGLSGGHTWGTLEWALDRVREAKIAFTVDEPALLNLQAEANRALVLDREYQEKKARSVAEVRDLYRKGLWEKP
jgi:hypothetical protein